MTTRHDQTQVASYFIWQKNGEKPGEDWRNWFEAEAQLQNDARGEHAFFRLRAPAETGHGQ